MDNNIATGITLILIGVVGFISRRKEEKNPWMLYGIYGSITALGIYKLLETPLDLPQKVAPWVFLAFCILCIVLGFRRFCKDKDREEQAKRKEEERSIE